MRKVKCSLFSACHFTLTIAGGKLRVLHLENIQEKGVSSLMTLLDPTRRLGTVHKDLVPPSSCHSLTTSSNPRALFSYLLRFVDLCLGFTHCKHKMNHSVFLFPSSASVGFYYTPLGS